MNTAKKLVRKLLNVFPAERPTTEEILEDSWFAEIEKEELRVNQLRFINLDFVVKKIKKQTMRRKLKKAMNGVYAVVKVNNMIKQVSTSK